MKLHNLKKIVGNLTVIAVVFLTTQCVTDKKLSRSDKKWFPKNDFKANEFKQPASEFGPFVRWWWPGNDVDTTELRREINTFADNGFGGVEIQPISLNVPIGEKTVKEKVLSWDSPSYYTNLKVVMDEAIKRNIIVDMTNGSGWPVGGPYLEMGDGFLTLDYKDKDIKGGEQLKLRIPEVRNRTGVPAKLIAVIASKIDSKNVSESKTVQLDPNSTINLFEKIKGDSIYWNVPDGKWKLISLWSQPNSKSGSMVAAQSQGPVLNLFDSVRVSKSFEYLFGARTGLAKYYGKPLRAAFDDSYEFAVDRHFSDNFLEYFKEKRGYDIIKWLPANMQDKYNYASFKNPNKSPSFSFGAQDWRLRYDYDITLSELLRDNFIKGSRNWLENKGMLHRTQVYGMRMDMIGNAGRASIPETESMVGPEIIMKVATSGAHLYNRPISSAESVVFEKRAYMTTPQKIKIAVDKLFSAGVNEIIYHGIPYKYINEGTTNLGWYPFYMGMGRTAAFSSHLGEGTQFWKYQKEVNEYIARTQYALRAGRPQADVLIYFPFMTVEGFPHNPEEILQNGVISDVESALDKKEHIMKDRADWAKIIYPIINQLEANGITWDWTNDESIQDTKLEKNNQLNIRGNRYQALIIAGDSTIQINTAKKINALAKQGMNLLAVGELPVKQPSYLNWEENDKITAKQMLEASEQANAKHLLSGVDLSNWIKGINRTVRFEQPYTFTRQIQREMIDGSRIQFIWNKSEKWQPFSLKLDKKYKTVYWLNSENGTIRKVSELNDVSYVIPPYGSVILYASTNKAIDSNLLSAAPKNVYQASSVLDITKWDINVGKVAVKNTALFDWKNNEQLKFTSEKGVYKAIFNVDQIDKNSTYLLDLGKVCFTADVVVNGKSLGSRIYAPYVFDISDVVREGNNTIEVQITPGQLNGLIGEAEKGNLRYKEFRSRTDDAMSSGLLGPVVIYKKKN